MPKWLDRIIPHLDIEGSHTVAPTPTVPQPDSELVSV
jgi:hypothetical protein